MRVCGFSGAVQGMIFCGAKAESSARLNDHPMARGKFSDGNFQVRTQSFRFQVSLEWVFNRV